MPPNSRVALHAGCASVRRGRSLRKGRRRAAWRPSALLFAAVGLSCCRTGTLAQPGTHGGPNTAACTGFQEEVGLCPDLPPCEPPVDCEFGDWEDWYYAGSCTGLCFRQRDVRRFSNDEGRPCGGATLESRECLKDPGYMADCPYRWHGLARNGSHGTGGAKSPNDCKWGVWSAWSDCSRPCGGGESSRYRHIEVSPHDGGAPCEPQIKEEIAACNTQRCRDACDDLHWSPWSEWEPCSVTCGHGLQWRRRDVRSYSSTSGGRCARPLPGVAVDLRRCAAGDDAEHGDRESGGGGGVAVDDGGNASAAVPKQPCTVEASQQACALSGWSAWDACEATCGVGERTRRRGLVATDIVRDLETQLMGAASRANVLQQQVAQLKRDNDALLSQNRDLYATVADLQRVQRGDEMQLSEAEHEASEAEERDTVLESDSARMHDELGSLTREVSQLQASRAAVQRHAGDLETANAQLRGQLGELLLANSRQLLTLEVIGALAGLGALAFLLWRLWSALCAEGARDVKYAGVGASTSHQDGATEHLGI